MCFFKRFIGFFSGFTRFHTFYLGPSSGCWWIYPVPSGFLRFLVVSCGFLRFLATADGFLRVRAAEMNKEPSMTVIYDATGQTNRPMNFSFQLWLMFLLLLLLLLLPHLVLLLLDFLWRNFLKLKPKASLTLPSIIQISIINVAILVWDDQLDSNHLNKKKIAATVSPIVNLIKLWVDNELVADEWLEIERPCNQPEPNRMNGRNWMKFIRKWKDIHLVSFLILLLLSVFGGAGGCYGDNGTTRRSTSSIRHTKLWQRRSGGRGGGGGGGRGGGRGRKGRYKWALDSILEHHETPERVFCFRMQGNGMSFSDVEVNWLEFGRKWSPFWLCIEIWWNRTEIWLKSGRKWSAF